MIASSPQRAHLVERAAEAARAAIAAGTPLARVPRPPLAPVQAIPAVEVALPPSPRSQIASAAARDRLAPIACALLRRAGLVSGATPAREEIALVRDQVLRSVDVTSPDEGRQARLVVITSARRGEGKSFAALNLAANVAEDTRRPVILVDSAGGADSLTALLGLRGAPGLEQLRDTGGPDSPGLLQRTEIPDLFVLPHGTPEPSGASGNTLTALLRFAGQLPNHLILLDTPPCLEYSTAGLFAAAAGQVVLVVAAERTKRAEVEAALDILDACPTLQLVLNRAALRVSDRFGGSAPAAGEAAVGGQS